MATKSGERIFCLTGLGDSTAETSLVTLEQSLEPNFKPPKPFDGLIKGKLSSLSLQQQVPADLGFFNHHYELLSCLLYTDATSWCLTACRYAGIAAQQLKNILDQLRGEVPKIKSGKPFPLRTVMCRLNILSPALPAHDQASVEYARLRCRQPQSGSMEGPTRLPGKAWQGSPPHQQLL